MRGFAAMCLVRFRRSLAAVYEVFKGSDALCARRNLFCWGFGFSLNGPRVLSSGKRNRAKLNELKADWDVKS